MKSYLYVLYVLLKYILLTPDEEKLVMNMQEKKMFQKLKWFILLLDNECLKLSLAASQFWTYGNQWEIVTLHKCQLTGVLQ